MANPQNLKPWKKGQSGNPKGQPPRKRIEQMFQDFLYDVARSKDGQERERLEVLLARMFSDGANGNIRATETLLAYGFGKPTQKLQHGGDPDGTPLQIVVASEKDKQLVDKL